MVSCQNLHKNVKTIFKQNYAQKLLIAFNMANSCCLGLKGNLDFPDFLQKSFITSITDLQNFLRKHLLQNFEAEVFDLLLLSLLEALHVGLGRETVEATAAKHRRNCRRETFKIYFEWFKKCLSSQGIISLDNIERSS